VSTVETLHFLGPPSRRIVEQRLPANVRSISIEEDPSGTRVLAFDLKTRNGITTFSYPMEAKVTGDFHLIDLTEGVKRVSIEVFENAYGEVETYVSMRKPSRIFVTRNVYQGRSLGGISGADAKCQAEGSQLGGEWIAWISGDEETALERIVGTKYVRLDGTPLAYGRFDLIDGQLLAPILYSIDPTTGDPVIWEDGTGTNLVWTGTPPEGIADFTFTGGQGQSGNRRCGIPGNNEDDWSKPGNGYVGNRLESNEKWTFASTEGCMQVFRLYCIEQAELELIDRPTITDITDLMDVSVDTANSQGGQQFKFIGTNYKIIPIPPTITFIVQGQSPKRAFNIEINDDGTEAVFTTPAGLEGDASVILQNADGSLVAKGNILEFIPAPEISSIEHYLLDDCTNPYPVSQPQAPTSGTGCIRIHGDKFSNTPSKPDVYISIIPSSAGPDKVQNSRVTYISDTEMEVNLQAWTPSDQLTSVNIRVQNKDGQFADYSPFLYIPPPDITDILALSGGPSQPSGPVSGTYTRVISGNDFRDDFGTTTVKFDGTPVTVLSVSPTEIEVEITAPGGVVTVPVVVTNPDGQVSSSVSFQFLNPPLITGIDKLIGPQTGGQTFTITGSDFDDTGNALQVWFDTTDSLPHEATVTHPASSGSVIVVTPDASLIPLEGSVIIILRNANGAETTSNPITYNFNPQPTITSITPASIPTSGDQITIEGQYFYDPVGQPRVTVDGVDATFVSFQDNAPPIDDVLVVDAPAGSGIGVVAVTVFNGLPDGQSVTAPSLLSYFDSVTITSLSPTSGPVTGGQPVTLQGSDLDESTVIKFDGPSGTAGVFDDVAGDGSWIRVFAPISGSTGSKNVIAEKGSVSDTLINAYSYEAAPVLTVWKFDNFNRDTYTSDSGPSLTANRQVGTETWYDLQCMSGGCPDIVQGKYGNGVYFSSNLYLQALTNLPATVPANSITFTMWLKQPPGLPSSNCIDFCHPYTVFGDVHRATLFAQPAGSNWAYTFKHLNLDSGTTAGSLPSSDLSWHHFAVTLDGSSIKSYRDGVLIANDIVSGGISKSDNTLRLGTATNFLGDYWTGGLDEFRIYDIPLTKSQINQDMASRYPLPVGSKGRPIVSYSFENEANPLPLSGAAVKDTHTLVKGRYGGAVSFDGVDDYYWVADNTALDIVLDLTLSALINPLDTGGVRAVVVKAYDTCSSGQQPNYALSISSGGTVQHRMNTNTGCTFQAGTSITNGEWADLTHTFDYSTSESKGRIFVNNQVTEYSLPQGTLPSQNNNALLIGYTASNTEPFKGAIDEISIGKGVSRYPYMPVHSQEVKVLSMAYYPIVGSSLDNTETGMTDSLTNIREKVRAMEDETTRVLINGTRYKGYTNNGATPSLVYTVMDHIELLKKTRPGLPYNAVFRPDYMDMLTNDVDVCDYVDNKGVREVWIWSYHHGLIEPTETNMAMGTVSSTHYNKGTYGDISNSEQTNDLPICTNTYVVYNYNYDRTSAEALHNHGHQIEKLMEWAENAGDLFSTDWVGEATPTGITSPGCGNVHIPPNGVADSDYFNTLPKNSDCTDWNPQRSGTQTALSCSTWSCSGNSLAYHLWWMQNLPGRNNGLDDGGNVLTNWWELKGDFDAYASTHGRSLTQ